MKEVEGQIVLLQPQEAKIQAEIAEKSKVINDAEKDLKIIKKGSRNWTSKIPNLGTELKQLVDNFEQNKKRCRRCKMTN